MKQVGVDEWRMGILDNHGAAGALPGLHNLTAAGAVKLALGGLAKNSRADEGAVCQNTSYDGR